MDSDVALVVVDSVCSTPVLRVVLRCGTLLAHSPSREGSLVLTSVMLHNLATQRSWLYPVVHQCSQCVQSLGVRNRLVELPEINDLCWVLIRQPDRKISRLFPFRNANRSDETVQLLFGDATVTLLELKQERTQVSTSLCLDSAYWGT